MNVKKKYCLTYTEFYLLAGSMGISHFYGFTDGAMEVSGEKDIIQLLFRLKNKHFLEVNETGYQVVAPIRQMLEEIRIAPKLIKVYATDQRFPMRCIYLGQNPVIVELGGLQGNFLKIYEEEWNTLFEDLSSDGVLLPQNVSDELLYQEQEIMLEEIENFDLRVFLQSVNLGRETLSCPKMNVIGVQTVLELHDTLVGKIKKSLLLITCPLIDIIAVLKADAVKIYCYSQNKLEELVREMQEE